MILSFVNLKGGPGKSTLCQNVAGALAGKEGPVAILDLDPQASIVHWAGRREALEERQRPLAIDVVRHTEAPTRAEVKALAGKYGHILIDAPANDDTAATAAFDVSDLVVIPLEPTPNNIDGTLRTVWLYQTHYRRRKSKPRLAMVINRTPPNAVIARQMHELIRQHWRPHMVKFTVGQRVAFPGADNLGKTVLEFEPQGQAAQEILAVTKVLRRMAG